jgi:hypothetical protein
LDAKSPERLRTGIHSHSQCVVAQDLFVFEVVRLEESASLERRDTVPKRLLELDGARLVLIQALGFFDAFDIRAESLSEKDFGEHLHAYDGHTTFSQ